MIASSKSWSYLAFQRLGHQAAACIQLERQSARGAKLKKYIYSVFRDAGVDVRPADCRFESREVQGSLAREKSPDPVFRGSCEAEASKDRVGGSLGSRRQMLK